MTDVTMTPGPGIGAGPPDQDRGAPLSVRRTWLAELALGIGGLALGTGEFAAMGILPQMAEATGVPIAKAGTLISAYALGVVIGAPGLAIIFARAPRRTMLIALMIGFLFANILSAMAQSYGMLFAARFIAGLPHGLYFGLAALVAASLAPPGRQAQAIARVMLGLTIANVIGVPAAAAAGQWFGWRATFVLVAGLGLLTAILISLYVPRQPASEGASPLQELSGLRRPQLWLTLLIAAVGFGGIFAVYTYIVPLIVEVGGISMSWVPLILSLVGCGMVAGIMFGGWLADRGVMLAIGTTLVVNGLVLLAIGIFPHGPYTLVANLMVMGAGIAVVPGFQMRLMEVAGEAQALAASLNHAAFNAANALGAWLGGVVVTAGYGWQSTGVVGAALALGGCVIFGVSLIVARRQTS